jgi:hypothetical protein
MVHRVVVPTVQAEARLVIRPRSNGKARVDGVTGEDAGRGRGAVVGADAGGLLCGVGHDRMFRVARAWVRAVARVLVAGIPAVERVLSELHDHLGCVTPVRRGPTDGTQTPSTRRTADAIQAHLTL